MMQVEEKKMYLFFYIYIYIEAYLRDIWIYCLLHKFTDFLLILLALTKGLISIMYFDISLLASLDSIQLIFGFILIDHIFHVINYAFDMTNQFH